jgi:hypothetical protein
VYDTKAMLDRIKKVNFSPKNMNQIVHEVIDIIEQDTEEREKCFQQKYHQPSDCQ